MASGNAAGWRQTAERAARNLPQRMGCPYVANLAIHLETAADATKPHAKPIASPMQQRRNRSASRRQTTAQAHAQASVASPSWLPCIAAVHLHD